MKKSNIYFLLFVFGLLLNACTYDFIVKEELPPVNPDVDVLFSTQIVPIFNTNNKCTACHGTGGTAPDLTAPNAYNSIKTMNLANTAAPATSKIYAYPGSAQHTQKKYTAAEAQLVLTWITQGAKNN